jgi:RNA exonuclease NGL2
LLDFNSQPAEALYALLVGEPLTQSQIASIESSKVIHVSVDPSVSAAPPTTASRAFFPVKASASSSNPAFDSTSTSTFQVESSANSTPLLDQEQGEAVDPDRAFTNVRNARESDGLLAVPELEALYAQFSTLRSAYDSGFRELSTTSFTYPKGSELQYKRAERTYGTRVNSAAARAIVGTTEDIGERSQLADLGWGETVGLAKQGFNEPMYTSFTHYWRLTLVRFS